MEAIMTGGLDTIPEMIRMLIKTAMKAQD